MCGIAGIVANGVQQYRETLKRMTDAIRHRGPDGDGIHAFTNCALGHRRLAIVDLATGDQPMLSPDGRVAVVFNGEIYGYRQLRRQLADYPFRTTSDTEVILAMYLRHGVEAAEKLPGMFAFAIWDDRVGQLYCARDRFGEKPFFFAVGRGGELLFGSEIKALLASDLISPQIDPVAVSRYLQRQCVAPDQSIYSNVRVLAPGHSLIWREGQVTQRRYWRFPIVRDSVSLDEAVEQVRALTRQAVERQLIADVPVGAFLSGGLDSSTVCGVASDLAPGLRTFSFDFEGDHSEVHFARAAAEKYSTQHVELTAPINDIATSVTLMQEVYDEPLADSSTIPSYLLAREASRHVKVALTGDAGDEFFGGYLWYQPLLWMQRAGRVGLARWIVERAINRGLALLRVRETRARERRIMGLHFARTYNTVLDAHRHQLYVFDDADLTTMGVTARHRDFDALPFDPTGSIDDAIRFDVADYMPANNLTRTDRAAMAHGLELRVPFLDVDLATFCLSLPSQLKVSNSEDKILLRRAFEEQWPAVVRKRQKQGFGAPISRWLADPAMVSLEHEYLESRSAAIYDFLSFDGVRAVKARSNEMQRWTLLILAIWFAHRRSARRP
jgi:asparagine synthase (glutamine-hydrolysing)